VRVACSKAGMAVPDATHAVALLRARRVRPSARATQKNDLSPPQWSLTMHYAETRALDDLMRGAR
jgi:hypothetical protein